MKSKSLLLLISIALCAALHAQNKTSQYTRLQAFASNVENFNHLYPQEKAYLHLDNTGYYLGERIYFQAYVVAATTLAPTDISRVLYVELLSAEGNIVETKKLKIENGRAAGDFFLQPDELFGGYYELRAYTRSMLNFSSECVFSRVFPVYDKPKLTGNYVEQKMIPRAKNQVADELRKTFTKRSNLNLTFFPEGGSLVEGLSSKVAFKATDKSGKSVEAKGVVYNDVNESVATFSTVHNGMGFFELAPDGKKYTAVVEHDGKSHHFDLPSSQPSGYAMRVDNLHPNNLRVYLAKSSNLPSDSIGIALVCRGKAAWFHAVSVGAKTLLLQIPKHDLPSGVAQLTLFGAGGEVYAERLIFIKNEGEPQVKITPSVRASYAPLSQISIDFQLVSNNKPVKTSFSLSVYDAATTPATAYGNNLMTSLLLTSDVKGYVENPAFYFKKDSRPRRLALDLLLMVQGWRRYEWATAASGKPLEVKHWIEKGLLVEGAALTDIRHKPMKDAKVSMWLLAPDTSSQRGECLTDEKGEFNFLLEDFYGEGDLNLMTLKDGKRQWSDITLRRNFDLAPRPYSFYETLPARLPRPKSSTPTTTADTAGNTPDAPSKNANVSRSYELEEVKVSAFQRWVGERNKATTVVYDMQKEVDKIRDKIGKGGAEYGLFFDQMMEVGKNLHCIYTCPEPIPGQFTECKWGCTYNGKPVKWVVFPEGMFMEYSEATAAFIEEWNKANPPGEVLADEVKTVIVDEAGYHDVRRLDGVGNDFPVSVVIYVILNKNRVRRPDNKGIRNTPFQGFYKPAEFFNPNYGEYVLPDEKDFRRTLYWNPNVETDAEGKATVQFYNNSSCREVGISAETLIDFASHATK